MSEPWETWKHIGFAMANPKHKTVKKLRKMMRQPAHAGLIEMRKCRATGFKVGLYDSLEAGMESDPETPYSTVCEEHGAIVCHSTLKLARDSMAYPEWCGDCQEIMVKKEGRTLPSRFGER